MYFLYSLLLTLGFVILLPRFALDALRNGKYVTGLGQRLGNIPPVKSEGRPTIWLHCVSVGEAQAAQSLVRRFKEAFPNSALVVSTTTVTGQQLARSIFSEHAATVFYFPIDWAWTVRRVLRKIDPKAIFIMETEFWPNLFRVARAKNTPVLLLNGRISDKSFRRYKRIRPFISRVLNNLTLAAMQSKQDANRIRELGMNGESIVTVGNLKFDGAGAAGDNEVTNQLRQRFSFSDGRPLFVAASTHSPEEEVILNAFCIIKEAHPNLRLLLAPRHPERFDHVASLLADSGFSVARRSASAHFDDENANIVLLDSIGELGAVFPFADIAFVGGSIATHGGHNVIEPAAHGVCTITGPHTANFAAITRAMLGEGALIQLRDAADPTTELAQVLHELLSDPQRRTEIGARARAVCESNRGATDRTLELISSILSPVAECSLEIPSRAHTVTAK
jgi:3-deoxy-D-manno-octulosonic-acid transferase